MRFRVAIGLIALQALASAASVQAAPPAAGAQQDLAEARRLFTANLDAIRHRDRTAYLACYLQADTLARAGPDGLRLGYRGHAEQSTDDSWPDRFEGYDLRLVPVRPGVVYGTYRYRVMYGEDESEGLSERLFVRTDDGWRIAVTSAFPAPPGTPPPPRALVGAHLVDGTGAPPEADAVVLMRDGLIECAGSRATCAVPDGVDVLNLSGFWITPGLVDAHVHFSQTGWADGRPDALDLRDRYPYDQVEADLEASPERFFRSYLCSGVTAVFDVGGYPWTWSLRDRAERDTRAPHVSAAGPLLSTLDHWLNLPAERQFIYLDGEETARRGVRYLAAGKTDAVKVWFIPPAEDKFAAVAAAVEAAGDEARRLGIPMIVHATELREAKEALRAGARVLVHSVWDQPVDDEFIALARKNHAIYCPTLTVIDGYQRMFAAALAGREPVVDDPHNCVDARTRAHVAATAGAGAPGVTAEALDRRAAQTAERHRVMAANLKRVSDAGITIAMGTDAGNPLTLHGPSVYAEMEAMQAAGLTPMQVLVASTRGGAIAMGKEDRLGTVEAGKAADLLVLAADPTEDAGGFRKVQFVVRGGELRPVEELAAPVVSGGD